MMMKPKRPVDNSAAKTVLGGVGAAMYNQKQRTEGQSSSAAKVAGVVSAERGLAVTQGMVAMILTGLFFVGLSLISIGVNEWWDAPRFLQATIGNWFVLLILLVVTSLALVGIGVAMFVTLPRFIDVKMRARIYDINESAAKSAGIAPKNPIAGLIYTAIISAGFFTLVYPLFLLQNVYEVFRVINGLAKGKSVSLRGDSGIYYDRMRKAYAQLLAGGYSRQDAEDMLREASLGMFTDKKSRISLSEWKNGMRDQVLATMIQRHGPVDAYVGKISATGMKAGESTANEEKSKDGIACKYTAV